MVNFGNAFGSGVGGVTSSPSYVCVGGDPFGCVAVVDATEIGDLLPFK
eukprot:CAMPEP_0201581956 /NCGR_PEP_ID=MMETSP0190_2-20130828/77879_1 /ASSEMBLY_ACC=CAM_ASM_000263 /TAXON_ID=37353 /ORGANISM="Rosalina sp." /LENGTH=47 /DNA_ID= /DNA_START= /DNA_END= /DNA_ORIENTATION=